MEIPAPLLRLAEDLNSNAPQRQGEERIDTARYAICLAPGSGPQHTVVQRLRLRPEEVAPTLREVRALLGCRGRRAASWEVGPSAEPADLAERLLSAGLVPDEGEPVAVGMVLFGPPALPAPPDIQVRRAESREEHFTASEILNRCFGAHNDHAARAEMERGFAEASAGGPEDRYLAYLAGVPIAAGVSVRAQAGVILSGGATLPEARSRGAYRALVHARYRAAAADGAALVTQAGALSRPILRAMGFVEVAEIRIFRDVLGYQLEGA